MKLLPNEKEVTSFYSIILTTHRVRIGDNSEDFSSIFLEKITAIQTKYFHSPILLILGVIIFMAGILFDHDINDGAFDRLIKHNPIFLLGIVGGGLLILIYVLTRSYKISIQSASSSIEVKGSNIDRAKIFEFIDIVEEAKNARYLGIPLDIPERKMQETQIVQTPPPATKCTKCGEEYVEGDSFCEKCGNKFPRSPINIYNK